MLQCWFLLGVGLRFIIPDTGNQANNSRIRELFAAHDGGMPAPPCALDLHFARWLKERRGDDTYASLSRVTGVPISTLHRLEMGQQSITLRLLEQILRRLHADPAEVFPSDWRHAPK